MKNRLVRGPIEVRASTVHGYGVFAIRDIPANTLIEEVHVLLINTKKRVVDLENYMFEWNKEHDAIPLGYGCIYNSTLEANVKYIHDYENTLMAFTTLRDVKQGDELFVNYGDDWFKARDTVELKSINTPKNPLTTQLLPALVYIVMFITAIYILYYF